MRDEWASNEAVGSTDAEPGNTQGVAKLPLGGKACLSLWQLVCISADCMAGANGTTKFWLGILNRLKNRDREEGKL